MDVQAEAQKAPDTGVFALAIYLRLTGVSLDRIGTLPLFPKRRSKVPDLVRQARTFDVKLRPRSSTWDDLVAINVPLIALLNDGDFVTLGRIEGDSAVVISVAQNVPKTERWSRFDLEGRWNGIVLVPYGRPRLKHVWARLLGLFRRVASPKPCHTGELNDGAGSGLWALALMLNFQGVGISGGQLQAQLGTAKVGPSEIIRAARIFGLKASLRRSIWSKLPRSPLPALATLRDGSILVLCQAAAHKVLVQRHGSPSPEILTRAAFEDLWDGRLLLIARRTKLGTPDQRFGLPWFLSAIYRYKRLLGEVVVVSFVLQLFGLVSPLFFQVVIDKVLAHQSISTLNALIAGLILIIIAEGVLGGLRTYLLAHTTNRIDVELGARLFHHLVRLPLGYFNARRVGDTLARVRELENIRQFLTGSALTLVLDLVFTCAFLAVMFSYSVPLTLVVVASLPLYVALSLMATPVFRRRLDEKFKRGSDSQCFVVECVTGIETLKAMAVEPTMQRRWEDQLAGYVAASFRVLTLNNGVSQAISTISKLVTALVLYFGARLVIQGVLSVGELVAFNMLAARLSAPVLRLAQMFQEFHQARLSIERMADILNSVAEPRFSPGRVALAAIQGRVSFEDVSFRYRADGPRVLDGVTFAVNPGEVLGVVGSSGSGKSTLTKLVQRLYLPETGRVLIDEMDLAMMDTSWVRRQIGVVLQDSLLFDGSIRDNIALADSAMPMEHVVAAATFAGAHEFIVAMKDGYDTLVGERGLCLSGGQRQRIGIARALALNPRILIFDEATSALDYASERIIQQNLRRIAAGRTVILVAHRLSTVRQADRILTLEAGRVVEEGTHDQLMRSNGRYAALQRMHEGLA